MKRRTSGLARLIGLIYQMSRHIPESVENAKAASKDPLAVPGLFLMLLSEAAKSRPKKRDRGKRH